MSAPFDADIVIIGYGPSGVSAANFLGSRGIRTIALERTPGIYERARAVTVDDWTMRCYQSVGLDDALKSVMDETVALRWLTYGGEQLRYVEMARGETENGHAKSYAIYQPAMEEKLRAGALRYAELLDIRYGVEVTGIAQDADGVTVTTTDVATGATATVRARYALACDGGSSIVRERLGIPLLGDTGDTRWVVIDAKVKRWWPDRQILTFWSDTDRPVVDIALAMGNHRWELPLRPEESESDFSTHEQLWALLATMGVSRDDVDIHQHAFYKHHVRQAARWRDGRVLLVGDAAHLMPPWAGQGMQSGIRDAHNLAWKLDAILAGRLSDTVLDSYQVERSPDVARCTMMSLALGAIIKREIGPSPGTGSPPPGPPPEMTIPMLRGGWLTNAGAAAVGRMIPQPRVATVNGRITRLDAVIGAKLVLLGDGIDPRALMTEPERAGWTRLGAAFHAVRAPDRASEAVDDIIDLDGELGGWMREHGVRVIAVRPDHFVAASDVGGLAAPGERDAVPEMRAAALVRN